MPPSMLGSETRLPNRKYDDMSRGVDCSNTLRQHGASEASRLQQPIFILRNIHNPIHLQLLGRHFVSCHSFSSVL